MRDRSNVTFVRGVFAKSIFGAAFLWGCSGTGPLPAPTLERGQLVFAEPEQAVEHLKAASASDDTAAYIKIFGEGAKELLSSGDAVLDRSERARFAKAVGEQVTIYREQLRDEKKPFHVAFLAIGQEGLSFPIALVKEEKGWRFDTEVGKEEVLNRRIGANELTVLELFEEYYLAQHEYAKSSHDGDPAGLFASRFLSSPGKQDGLYWNGEPSSPLGPLVADMESQGYVRSSEGSKPVYGYFFRILKKQGANARGGARDFRTSTSSQSEKLQSGFGLIAYPANWGNTGVMTFIMGPDGFVYQKNLGPDTAAEAAKIEEFDPDLSWNPA